MSNQWTIFTRVSIDCPTERAEFSSREEAEAYLAAPVTTDGNTRTESEERDRIGVPTEDRYSPNDGEKQAAVPLQIRGLSRKDCNIWQGPIPIVSLSQGAANPFTGHGIREVLRVDPDDDPTTLVFDDLFERTFRDHPPQPVLKELARMQEQGLISSNPGGVPSPQELKLLLERTKKYDLPGISCSLGEDWDFVEIASDANNLWPHWDTAEPTQSSKARRSRF